MAGMANAASLTVRMALLPKNVYLEKKCANGIAMTTEIRALNVDSRIVKPRILHV